MEESKQPKGATNKTEKSEVDKPKLLEYIRKGVIGSDICLKTPYGKKPMIYTDYTASGRSLSFIEDYIKEQILPLYANTHNLHTRCAKQTTYYRNEAKEIVRRVVGATEIDAVLFTGHGSTAAINHIVNALRIPEICNFVNWANERKIETTRPPTNQNLHFAEINRFKTFDCKLCSIPLASQGKYFAHESTAGHQAKLKEYQANDTTTGHHNHIPLVITSVQEHHSNMLPWREAGAEIIEIKLDAEGVIDYKQLEEVLKANAGHPRMKIGTFSAGSNITGILTDTDYISYLLHKYGFLAFFDYAACAPYVEININGPVGTSDRVPEADRHLCYKDALFISPHKFVGAPDTPGLLICKKELLAHRKPHITGGGIVFFVDELSHVYTSDIEEREHAGTPSIIGAIRAGMVFQLKEQLTADYIMQRDREIIAEVDARLATMKNVVVLGNMDLDRIPIYSFMIKFRGSFLHFNFVGKLLNDLFGIQPRTGCSCASIYGQKLLGIGAERIAEIKEALCNGYELLRIGYIRLNFPYFQNKEERDYVLNAIEFVSEYGWMFMPNYHYVNDTAEWGYRLESEAEQMNWLGAIDYSAGKMEYLENKVFTQIDEFDFKRPFVEAQESLLSAIKDYKYLYGKSTLQQKATIDEKYHFLIWYVFPSDVLQELIALGDTSPKFEDLKDCVDFTPGYLDEQPWIPLCYGKKGDCSTPTAAAVEEQPSPATAVEEEEEEEDDFFSSLVVDETTKEAEPTPIEIPNPILRAVGEAVNDFEMIKEGDRVLVAISGGKDSLSLLHILKNMQRRSPVKFDIGAVTIDPQVAEYDPSPLKEYMAELGVPYFYEEEPIVKRAETEMQNNSLCSYCSRIKRGMIYAAAKREGYNVIAMGQHLDDLAESFLMSAFHNGYLRTMKACYITNCKQYRVIRPLIYCREKLFKDFAKTVNLPLIAENCPACFSEPKERHRIKLLLAQQEHEIPSLFQSMLQCMRPLMKEDLGELTSKAKKKLQKLDEADVNVCGGK